MAIMELYCNDLAIGRECGGLREILSGWGEKPGEIGENGGMWDPELELLSHHSGSGRHRDSCRPNPKWKFLFCVGKHWEH